MLLYAAMLSASTGCYNGDALVDRVRNDALRYRLEEVDLGEYRVTMPRNLDTGETVEVAMHLFGSLARYKQPEVEQMMEKDESLLRYRTVVAVRESTHDDFTDPDFLALRGRLLEAVNGLLPEPAVQSVGFRNIRFMRN
ncbi:MAG: hypothetical protein AAF589_06510 [Planctomycetota bacterium]